jgi:hypothetical protein
MLKLVFYILVYGARWLLLLEGDSLILLDVMKVGLSAIRAFFSSFAVTVLYRNGIHPSLCSRLSFVPFVYVFCHHC